MSGEFDSGFKWFSIKILYRVRLKLKNPYFKMNIRLKALDERVKLMTSKTILKHASPKEKNESCHKFSNNGLYPSLENVKKSKHIRSTPKFQ